MCNLLFLHQRNILFHHLRISSDKAIFPPLASHNFGSRPHGRKNNAGISALQGSGPLPLLPALSLLFCICCGKIPYTFRQIQSVQETVVISIVCIKPLNLLLLGENYARTMGMNIKRSRTLIFISTALLTGTVTAFCGPVGFIGLAVPHVTRLLFNNADHRILVPATMLTGLISMLLCDIIAKKFLLPVNCITALLGVPVILWVIAKNLHGFK